MAKNPTRPLKVTAKLIDGRINSMDGIIMFDSILYHAWFMKYAPSILENGGIENLSEFENIPDEELPTGITRRDGKIFIAIGLPLRKENEIYYSSMGIYKQISEKIEYWNKRPDFFAADKMDYINIDKGIISDSVGTYRAYRTPVVIRTIKDNIIDFYCVGSKEKIIDLLSYIPAIGKKPAMGWGIVSDWSVEDIDEDYSQIHPQYGIMRPTPVNQIKLDDYKIMEYAVKPPYWKKCNKRMCYIPMPGGNQKC